MTDMLVDIYMHQYELQKRLGVYDKMIKNSYDKFSFDSKTKQRYINQMILAIQEEAVEIMRETAYKNPDYVEFGWKKGQKFNSENFKEEIIDIIHFVMNLAIISGMSPEEIHSRYIGKNKQNHKRQDDGY